MNKTLAILLIFTTTIMRAGEEDIILNEIHRTKEAVVRIENYQQIITFINTVKNHESHLIRDIGDDAWIALQEQFQTPSEFELVETKEKVMENIENLYNEYFPGFGKEETRSILIDIYLEVAKFAQHLKMINDFSQLNQNNNN